MKEKKMKNKELLQKKYMKLAIELAKKGTGRVHPNPLVGCIIVKDAQIVGQGFHAKYGEAHAEVNAIRDACHNVWEPTPKGVGLRNNIVDVSRKNIKPLTEVNGFRKPDVMSERFGVEALNGAEMFVTLEPCNHFGKTPPCTKAIIESGIRKVFVAMLDPNSIVSGNGVRELKKHGIVVEVGLCKNEAMQLNEAYIKWVKKRLPFVLLKIAVTKEGFISWGNGKRKRISGKESLEKVQELRNEFDAVLVGTNTVLKDNPKLTCRMKGGRNPIRIVLDSELEIPLKSNFLKKEIQFLRFDKTSLFEQSSNGRSKACFASVLKSFAERIIFCGKKAMEEKGNKKNGKEEKKKKIEKLKKTGVKVFYVKEKNGLLDLKEILKMLGKMQIVSVLVEGGQAINSSFLKEKLADKLMFIVGEKKVKKKELGKKMKNGLFFVNEKVKKIKLKKVNNYLLGKDFVIEGYL